MSNTSSPTPPSGDSTNLPQWGEGTKKNAKGGGGGGNDKPSTPRKRRRWPKIVLALLILLVVGAGVLITFAPAIASSMAPGYIEAAAKKEIKGSVKVKELSLSWGGPLKVGPIELYDDKDKLVGVVEAKVAPGLWKIVSEQWWAQKNLDIGQVEVSGKLNVVKDGEETNLNRAIAPTSPPKPKPPKSGGGPFDSIKGVIKVTGLDVTFTDNQAPTGTPMAAGVGVTKFAGDVKVDYDAKAGGATAKADLTGALKGAGSGSDKLTLAADVNLKRDAKGQLEQIAAKLDVLGAPLDLVDGLANFGGELVKSIGARGDLRVQMNGNLDKATATLNATSEGASADMEFEYSGGILKASKPGVIKVRSTDFVAGMPSLKQRMKDLAKNVRLEAGPSVEITIASLALPVPKASLEAALGMGAPGAAAPKLTDLDLRAGGAADITIAVGAQRGMINTGSLNAAAPKDAATPPAAPGAAPAPAPGDFKPFAVQPLTLRISAPKLDSARITASTNATVENKPAGQLAVDLTVRGLLDASGHFNPQAIQGAEGEAKLSGVTTALLQPIVSATGLPVDMTQDVGPTLDLVIKPKTGALAGGAGGGDSLPPVDVNLTMNSANIQVAGDLRYEQAKTQISTLGNGFSVQIASAGPLVSRVMSKPGAPAGPATVSGKLPVTLTVHDALVDTKKTSLSDIKATAEIRVGVGQVALNLAKPEPGKPAPAAPAPIMVNGAVVIAALAPGSPAALAIQVSLAHENNPFAITGNFTAPGLATPGHPGGAGGAPAKQGAAPASPIDRLLDMKLAGRLEIQDAPRTLTAFVPSVQDAIVVPGDTPDAEIRRLIWGMIGPSVDVTLTTESAEGAQRAKIDIATAGVTATTTASVTPSEVSVSTLSAQAVLGPSNVNPVLAAMTPKAVAAPGQPAMPPNPPMVLADGITLQLNAEPFKAPFKPGTTEPDWAKVKEVVVRATTDKPILVSSITAKPGQQEAAGLGSLVATARVPGTYLAGAKDAALITRVTAELLRPTGGGAAWSGATKPEVCAKAEIDATLPADKQTAETAYAIKLIDVNTVALSPLTGDPLLLPGTLGDKVQIVANIKQSPDRLTVQADVDAPRLKGAAIRGSTQSEVFRVDAAKMTWTPSVQWFNSAVFASKDGSPSDQLAQETTFTMDVKSLAAAIPKSDAAGNPTQGPMKPGVFNADLSLTAPKMIIKRPDGKTVQAEDIRVAVTGGQKPKAVAFDATIARVTGEGAASTKPSMLHATVDNLCDDRGVIQRNQAVLNASGDLEAFPTPLIDSLAKQNGKVVDFLGSTLNLKLSAQNLSNAGGNISATASSPRAAADLKGVVRDNTFVQDGKFEVDIYELIRYEIAKKLPGGMPLVGFIEKKKGVDEPGKITATGLRVPMDLDKDMRKLNGVITVDPGTASFEFNDAFSKILKQLSQKDRGQVGRRLEPFVVNIKDGVATYDKFKLQFGEFNLETTGVADLVTKQMNVVTYVPAGAVTEEILNLFKGSLGKNAKGFTADTRFPFTTKGPLENPKTEPDFGLFIKENAGKLIEDLGKGALEDLLKKVNKNK